MVNLKLMALLAGLMISGIYSAGGTGGNEPGSQAEPSQNPQTAYYDLLDEGAYGLNIEGLWTIGPGPDAIPWAIWFEDSEAFLLADVQPTDGDSEDFHDTWESGTSSLLRQLAEENLGEELAAFTPFTENSGDGGPIYGMEYTYSRKDTTFYVTVCYRFCDAYTLELISLDPDSQARSRRVAVNTADSFTDLGGPRHITTARPEVMLGGENWPWKYLHNPFAVSAYYMDIESPPPPSEERRLTDYEIRWIDAGMEILVRAVIDKPEGTVMSSDLDRIEEFAVIGWLGDFYRVRTNDRMVELPREGITVRSIEDLLEFQNLRVLDVELTDLEDVRPIASMTGLESLSLMVSPELKDLEFLRPLERLKTLMMWGGAYPNVTDISVFQNLTQLKSVMIILPEIRDLSVFAALPNLEQLWINCHEDVNLDAVIQAKQIQDLMVNAQTIR